MSTVLQFRPPEGRRARRRSDGDACEIVIFPGVRIERAVADLDLGHRIRDSLGGEGFDGAGGGRPRKTS